MQKTYTQGNETARYLPLQDQGLSPAMPLGW